MRDWTLGLLSPCLVLCCLPGCADSPDPLLKLELDNFVLAVPQIDKSYSGKSPFERMPLAVGQWVEYLGFDEEEQPRRLHQEVVGQENGGFWIELNQTTYYAESPVKILVVDWDTEKARGMKVVQALRRDEGGKIKDDPELASALEVAFRERMDFKVNGDRVITLTVPAGSFENTIVRRVGAEQVHHWFHSDVPLLGIVKALHAETGERWTLIGFGDGGSRQLPAGP